MLVKVSQKYCGTLGIFNKDTNSVIQKDKTSAPFEMDDALASRHIRNGILVAGDTDESVTAPAPYVKEDPAESVPDEEPDVIPEDVPEEIPEEVPDGIPEDNPIDEEDLDSITDYKVLKKMAKDAGINPFGKNKDELREAIREANA